jgi:serine/threonine protein phosphatase 1
MSTYVMSDIHGMYDDYRKLLEIIDFSDKDLLYVNGDVIDRGEDGIKVLRHMAMESNILPVLGNHEYMAARCLRFLLREVTDESIDALKSDFLEGLLQWREVGGNKTIEDFSGLSVEEREDVLDYLSEFTPYEETNY